jgi:hypothetical protein
LAENSYYQQSYARGQAVAFGSATGGAGPLPVFNTLLADPINVVTTSVDSTGMHDVSNHLIFTGAISMPLGISVTLNFQINRIAEGGGAVRVGPSFTFTTTAVVLESEAFAFQFTDRNLKPGNYTYSVDISTNSIIDVTPGLTINNAVLTVIAFND